MVPDTIFFGNAKKFAETDQGYLCVVPKKRADLRTIHDENDVLTDNELVVARDFFKNSKLACLYIRNKFPRGFCVK